VNIYRISHIDNLPLLLEQQGLWCGNVLKDNGLPYKTIGNQDLTAHRADRSVRCSQGGNLNDYVPFYFCPRSVMLYLIHKKHETTYGGGQEPVIHLRSSTEVLSAAGLKWFFTDRNAHISYAAQIDDPSKLNELDLATIQSNTWHNTAEDPDRKERKMAECLVHRFVPWNCITGIGVFSQRYREDALAILTKYRSSTEVRIASGWYY
jgi:hypothetical protein